MELRFARRGRTCHREFFLALVARGDFGALVDAMRTLIFLLTSLCVDSYIQTVAT
jgi:hypothetical protein